MTFGIVGLGRMGASLSLQAMEKQHQVVGYDTSDKARQEFARAGLEPAVSLDELVSKLESPGSCFYMCLTASPPTASAVNFGHCSPGTTSWLMAATHTGRTRSEGTHSLPKPAIGFLDIGTSGGIEGARHGACFMVGGDRHVL